MSSQKEIFAELGIQIVRSFGITGAVLTNPTNKTVDRLGVGDDGCLYAMTADKVYKRTLTNKLRAEDDIQT